FAQTRHAGMTEVAATIERDLSGACGARVGVTLRGPSAFKTQALRELDGESLDDFPVTCVAYDAVPDVLSAGGGSTDEALTTHFCSSLCRVAAHPDIASLQIA